MSHQFFQPVAGIYQHMQIDPGFDPLAVCHVDDIFRGHIARSSRNKGATARSCQRAIKPGNAGLHTRQHIGNAHATGIVEVQDKFTLRITGIQLRHKLIDLQGHRHTGRIRDRNLRHANRQIGVDDLPHLVHTDHRIPGRTEGTGDGTGDLQSPAPGQIGTGRKALHGFQRQFIDVGQVMALAGRDVQLHLLAATVDRAADTTQIRHKGTVLHPGQLLQIAEHLVGIGHLGHGLRMHEGSDLDDANAGALQTVDHFQLLIYAQDPLFDLHAVPKADLADRDIGCKLHCVLLTHKAGLRPCLPM